MSSAKPKPFESSLEELERIVRELEQGDIPLEKSLELFEQGVKLSRECQDRLNQAERRIEILEPLRNLLADLIRADNWRQIARQIEVVVENIALERPAQAVVECKTWA